MNTYSDNGKTQREGGRGGGGERDATCNKDETSEEKYKDRSTDKLTLHHPWVCKHFFASLRVIHRVRIRMRFYGLGLRAYKVRNGDNHD